MRKLYQKSIPLLLLGLLALPLSAQEAEAGGTDFAMTIELGAQTFNEKDDSGDFDQVTYQSLSLNPEFIFGKIGVGMAFTVNYRFVDDGGGSSFEVREQDWIPDDDNSFLDLYLPIFRYVRYGYKGDPLYAKIGSIDNGSLGTGFLMANYSNSLFLPELRKVGLALDVDGQLFDFPYLGVESFVGNLANFDVIGSRLYVRPLMITEIPILKNLQIGGTFAADTKADAHTDFDQEPDTVSMFSFDFIQPLLNKDLFSLNFYGDMAFQPGGEELNQGVLVGVGGRAFKFVNYGLNSLFIGDNFVPFYFDAAYDLYRESKYRIYSGTDSVEGYAGWQSTLGFQLLGEAVQFNTTLSGSFSPDSSKPSTLPHLRSTLVVAEGLLPGVFFDLSYDKRNIASFDELIDPENALILANVNYKTGPAVITLGYTLRYRPEDGNWETSAKLSSSISL
ncbi:MAG TPA: hypothetical protein ENN41_05560 [Sediminispirochaeta sp.]|nr:hypothetical protein [Sediminispirochaeta sp.]